MQAIYASKMYRASKNKDKIKAALKDPMNAELVTQLKSYLDKEYQQPKYVDPDSAEPDKEPKDRPEETIIPSEHSSGGGGGFSGGSGGMDHHLSDSLKDDEFGEFDDSMPAEPSGDDESGSDEEVAESTKVKKTAVKAGTCVVTNSADEADSIKGMLNSRDDCAGVVRIIVKDILHLSPAVSATIIFATEPNIVRFPAIVLTKANRHQNSSGLFKEGTE